MATHSPHLLHCVIRRSRTTGSFKRRISRNRVKGLGTAVLVRKATQVTKVGVKARASQHLPSPIHPFQLRFNWTTSSPRSRLQRTDCSAPLVHLRRVTLHTHLRPPPLLAIALDQSITLGHLLPLPRLLLLLLLRHLPQAEPVPSSHRAA